MEHLTLGRTNGFRVSQLVLGTGTFGTRWGYGAHPEDAEQIFEAFADAGGTAIDTAESYQVGEAEEILGRLLTGRRDQFTVATKFGNGGAAGTGVLQTGDSRRAMRRALEGSLRRLGTDYVDLLWVHFPDGVTPVDEIMRTFDDLISEGKMLYGGLSNFPAWQSAQAATLAELRGWAPLAAVQFEYSLIERSGDRENLPMAEVLGLGAALWSPLAGGLLSGKYRSGSDGRLADWGGRLTHTEDDARKAATVDTVLAAAADLGVPPVQVAVAWLLERARRARTGVVPVIGPRTVAQLHEYLGALDVTLGPWYTTLDEVSRIDLGQPHLQDRDQLPVLLGGAETTFRRF